MMIEVYLCVRKYAQANKQASERASKQAGEQASKEALKRVGKQLKNASKHSKAQHQTQKPNKQTIKFYISDPLIFKNDSLFESPAKRYHLVDLNNPESLILQTKAEDFDEIQFNIGIDKQTNLDGVRGGDLDPLKGMYWTWNTGSGLQ